MALDKPSIVWQDERLIAACLSADENAWHALVEKYKRLVYSIIVQYTQDESEAGDLFQGVWLDVFNDLPKLRATGALRTWLVTLARNRCFQWKRRRLRRESMEFVPEDPSGLEAIAEEEPSTDLALRDQLVREAITRLSTRCRELVELLFFAQPPLPYREVADKLGLAVGSIGFIRGRCLRKLQEALEAIGLSS